MTMTQLEHSTRPLPEIAEEQFVIQEVLAQLGRPQNLYRINAEKLWNKQYRVNIYRTVDSDRPVKTRVMSDSFFVTVTENGIVSEPPITRKYMGSDD